MRCDTAQRWLQGTAEPSDEQLAELFEHVDTCVSCVALDESLGEGDAAFAALLAAAPVIDLESRVAERLGLCDEPEGQPVEELEPCPPALRALASREAPSFMGFSDRLEERLGVCDATIEALAAADEPSALELGRVFDHVDACIPCQSWVVGDRPAQITAMLATAPAGLVEGVMGRVERAPARLEAWRRGFGVVAMAASLLLAAWLLGGSDPESGPLPGRQLASEGGALLLRDFVPGVDWAEASSVLERGSESSSNEATLPEDGVEYSLPSGEAAPSPEAQKQKRAATPRRRSALSF